MKTIIFFLLSISFIVGSSAQKTSPNITINCQFDNCSVVDTFVLYDINGLMQTKLATAKLDAKGVATFTIPRLSGSKFFGLGVNAEAQHLKLLLLGTEDNVKVTGPCFDMTQAKTENSKINAGYDEAVAKANVLKEETGLIVQDYQKDYNDVVKRTQNETRLGEVDKKKIQLLNDLKKSNPMVEKILALDTYTSYQNDPKKADYASELDYFGKQYFQYANLSDTAYNQVPLLTSSMRNYVNVITIRELKLPKEAQMKYIDNVLNRLPTKSTAYKFGLSGVLLSLLEKQSALILPYGEKYIKAYPTDDPNFLAQLSQTMNTMKTQMVDVPAPEIVQSDTAGVMRKLSDLKGKYVLIDFWASWCGPCRRENPTVVAMYKKYHEKGFEVFSVSLDRDKQSWINAINQDGLLWANHVSDLKNWGNAAAATYGVQSIPRTVLVDKDGNIVAHNLRGEELEKRLKDIFGM